MISKKLVLAVKAASRRVAIQHVMMQRMSPAMLYCIKFESSRKDPGKSVTKLDTVSQTLCHDISKFLPVSVVGERVAVEAAIINLIRLGTRDTL